MGAVVEVGDGRFVRRFAAPGDARAKRDAGHRDLPVCALFQNAFRFIDIASTISPSRRAKSIKNSMWHDESEATNASSGSTPAGSDQGAGTTCGLGEAGTSHAAVERPFVRAAVLALGEVAVALAGQRIVAV